MRLKFSLSLGVGLLCAFFLVLIPSKVSATFQDMLDHGYLCYCVSENCRLMISPSGFVSGGIPSNCPQGLTLDGKLKDVYWEAYHGRGCGSITQLQQTVTQAEGGGGSSGIIMNFSCKIPSYKEVCMCKEAGVDQEKGEAIYQCAKSGLVEGEFPDIYSSLGSGYTVNEDNSDCSAEFRVALPVNKGCCCLTISEGALNAERKCVVVEATGPGANPVCSAEATFSAETASNPMAKVELSSLSKDGTCTEQEKVLSGTLKPEDRTVDAGKQLGAEAATVLNPMKFKLGSAGVNDFIGRAINALTFSMGSLLLVFYVYAGILWMTAAGNSERAGKAKQIVVWSTLGVVVILASYMIVSFVFKIVG